MRVNIPPNGQAADTDGNSLDQVQTEMVQLDLSGISSMGPVTANLDPRRYTLRTAPALVAKLTAWADYDAAERPLAAAIKRLG